MFARIILSAIVLAFLLGGARSQDIAAPFYRDPRGVRTPAIGVFCLDLAGGYTACGGGAVSLTTVTSPYLHSQVAVGASAVQVLSVGAAPNMRTVKASTGNSGLCFLGSASVTPSNGFPISPGESLTQDVRLSTAALYAVCANPSQTIAIIGF
jgi:hypothetical protein